MAESPSNPSIVEDALPSDQVVDFLNLLLECERAGAKALRFFMQDNPPDEIGMALPGLLRDEARYCAGLTAQLRRLGADPSSKTGSFYIKAVKTEGWASRLDLLARGQNWVAARIAEMLPRLGDPQLRQFLAEMEQTHHVNVAAAQDLGQGAG